MNRRDFMILGLTSALTAPARDSCSGRTSNGSANDTRTLQAAITAAAGQVLTLDPANYRVTSSLNVPANTTIRAYGATLTWTSQTKGLILAAGARLYGGTLVGPGGRVFDEQGYAIYSHGTRGADGATAPTYIGGPTIQDVTIHGWGFAGIFLEYLRNALVLNNVIGDIGYCGIGGASVEDVRIERNVVDGVAGSGAPDTYGIAVDRREDTIIRDPQSKRVRIAHNTVKNVPNWEGIDTHGGEDFEIVYNVIEACRFPIVVIGSDILGSTVLAPKRVNVAHNNIAGSDRGAAITVAGAISRGSVQQHAEDCRVTNNTIRGGGAINDASEGCIRIYATRNLVVDSNSLDQPWLYGINAIIENVGLTITRNRVKDARDPTYSAPAHIAITGKNNEAIIENNVNIFENASASMYVSIHAIRVGSGLTGLDVRIDNNQRINSGPSRLLLSFATTTGLRSRN